MKKVILLLSAVAAFTTSTQAQFSCGTDDVNNRAKQLYPEIIAKNEAKLKADLLAELSKMDLSQFAKTTTLADSDDAVLHVPIVFHIVHDYGSEYRGDEAVYEALDDINKCFNKQNPDTIDVISTFKTFIPGTAVRYIGNARIKFHLAQKDPSGNPTKGITRRRSWLTSIAGDQAKADQWPPQSYMNIWLIRSFDVNHSTAGAYAYNPGTVHNTSLVFYDGIIGLAQQTISDHTLAHELAHTLNIPHTWGNTNNPNVQCGDDGIDDTPPTKGHDGGGCAQPFPLYDSICASGYDKTYAGNIAKNLFGVGDGDPNKSVIINYPDTTNAQNIMDYTGCSKMFTYLQTVEMRSSLRSNVANRNNLMSEGNLILTGIMDPTTKAILPLKDIPPIADFSTNVSTEQNNYACIGQNITFTNRSWNDTISSVSWTFTDAGGATKSSNSSTTTAQNFSNSGWLSVSLTANSNAGTNTITRDSAVYIAKNVGTPGQGYMQTFSNEPDINEYPIFNPFNNENKWSLVTNVGCYDNTSMRMNAYDSRVKKGIPSVFYNTPIGDLDEFYTPPFDLSSYTGQYCNLNFMLSAASTTGDITAMTDVLEISYRSCGALAWTPLKSLSKGDLITAGIDTTDYVPKSLGDWQARSYLIPTNARSSNIVFRFRYRCGGKVDNPFTGYRATGNNVYIDRISFNDFPTDVDGVAYEKNGFALAPNPTTGSTFVVINGSANASKTLVQVTDMTGKVVYSTETNVSGNARIEIPANYISVKGIYMVSVITNTQKHTDKLVVY